ncbi:unnamed protein product [Peniophora sp. CBMAI 1063]|nr:unnamed protein product [Peniophora sp. CBMAI 1063]
MSTVQTPMMDGYSTTVPLNALPEDRRSSVSGLPVEILSAIFCHLASSAAPTLKELHAPAPPWCPVLHVCRWWRRIALETKDLWRLIPLGNAEWTKMALRLSHPRSISLIVPEIEPVDGSETTHDFLPVVMLVLPELHRAYCIHLGFDWTAVFMPHANDRSLFARLKNVDPVELVDLRLQADDIYAPVHSAVFKSEPARLRSLNMDSYVLHEHPDVFANTLTTLRLDDCSLTPTYNLTDLISNIALMQSLEVLEVSYLSPEVLETLSFGVEGIRHRVLLPHLKDLTIQGPYLIINACLTGIESPPHCFMRLKTRTYRGYHEPSSADSVRSLSQSLGPRFASSMSDSRMRLNVTLGDAIYGRGTFEVKLRGGQDRRIPGTRCAFEWGTDAIVDDEHVDLAPLSSLVAILPNDIAISSISIDVELTADDWRMLHPLLARVRVLRFRFPQTVKDFPLVCRGLDDAEMPQLEEIEFNCLRLPGAQTGTYFSLMRAVIQNCLPRGGFKIMMLVGRGWPTQEDLETIGSYGGIPDGKGSERRRLMGTWLSY